MLTQRARYKASGFRQQERQEEKKELEAGLSLSSPLVQGPLSCVLKPLDPPGFKPMGKDTRFCFLNENKTKMSIFAGTFQLSPQRPTARTQG